MPQKSVHLPTCRGLWTHAQCFCTKYSHSEHGSRTHSPYGHTLTKGSRIPCLLGYLIKDATVVTGVLRSSTGCYLACSTVRFLYGLTGPPNQQIVPHPLARQFPPPQCEVVETQGMNSPALLPLAQVGITSTLTRALVMLCNASAALSSPWLQR